PRPSPRRRRSRGSAPPSRGLARQPDPEAAPLAERALDVDPAAVFLHDAIGDGEAESRAFAERLPGEEGIEDRGDLVLRDPPAAVGDREHRIAPRMAAHRVVVSDLARADADRHLRSPVARLDRVDDDVRDDLLQLARVRANAD